MLEPAAEYPLSSFSRLADQSRAGLQELFAEQFGIPRAEVVARQRDFAIALAPGRVNLIGEHTDYNDGYVFPMALELGVALFFRARNDDRVRLYATGPKELGEFSLGKIERSTTQPWLNYPLGVAHELIKAGVPLTGLEGVIAGNLPIGAGLSSSAALELACAQGFLLAAGRQLSRLKLAQLCRRAENEFVGLNCGIMDQFVSLFAEMGTALFLDTRSLLYRHVLLPPPDRYTIAICDSGVKHALAGSEYNLRHRECEQAVELLKARLPHIAALRDLSPAEFHAQREHLPEPLRKRAEHVVFENERTLQARDALEAGDFAGFGELMNQSHESLRDLYQVSCAELDALVELARSVPGVLGSRMTGGGFGGCTVSLVEKASWPLFREKVATGYQAAFGADCRIFASSAAGGATVI